MRKHYLITGGAGFIGSNYCAHLLENGQKVTVFDNLSRMGTESNLAWLKTTYGENAFDFVKGDVRDLSALQSVMKEIDVIVHLAAQVAVTTSVSDPRTDFEINALGTFNVLEAARLSKENPIIIYASTNKVYGGMEDVRVNSNDRKYYYEDFPSGIPENQLLDFHSPYGCSKGAGDQYMRDYHRIYDMRTVVFRQSCIYGTRQFGVEDQGWVAWFVIAAQLGKNITIYGNGKQVRDILFVSDLCRAYDAAIENIDVAAGQIFNIGGGPKNTLSIWKEFCPILEEYLGKPIPTTASDWRPGDQPIYVSNIQKANDLLKWQPQVTAREGIEKLFDWVKENKELFE
ncbi:MAG: SDR family NAD(P)-dependent oxidoreductase [Anaerolineaceae bacterium]|nr:SDR family NAD(P)-dependent oxidoreductase [Anaerolineaceae bacterium]